MTARDAPVEPSVRQHQQPAERVADQKPAEAKSETPPVGGADFGSRLGLTAGSPQETLKFLSEYMRNAGLTGMPEVFGRFDLKIGAPTDLSAARRREELPPGVSKIERTRINGTGAAKETQVEIRYGMDGKPNFVRDHLGEWKSKDGGKTWKTDEPHYRVRRGEVSIDDKGNYSINNPDYGIKSTFSRDGNVTRTMTNAAGEQFSVTRNKEGAPTGFSDRSGEWTGDGKNWKNAKSGETKNGTVVLTEFGEFRFKPNKGDASVERTPQLERINKIQDEICKEFGVRFARPGESIKNDDRDRSKPEEAKLYAGVPTEAELEVLKETLTNTRHEDYRGMKMWFIRPDESKRTEFALYDGNATDKPHTGGCACHSKAAQKDIKNGDLFILPRTRQELRGFEGVEGVLYHELGHHEQKLNLGWEGLVGPKSTPEGRRLAADMGWQWSDRHKAPVMQDKNGGLWRHDSKNDEWRWAGGKEPKDKKCRIDDEKMRNIARITPISEYNTSPDETHAEALSGFRVGETGKEKPPDRRTLAIDSPKMYEVMKKYDQERINVLHKPHPNGEPTHIRGLDGKIIENTPANKRAISEREHQWNLERMRTPKLPKDRSA